MGKIKTDKPKADSEESQAGWLEIVDAINFVFMLFRDAYHNQFLKAFPTQEARDRSRALWSRCLEDVNPQHIKKAAIVAAKSDRFLPTLCRLRDLATGREDEEKPKDD